MWVRLNKIKFKIIILKSIELTPMIKNSKKYIYLVWVCRWDMWIMSSKRVYQIENNEITNYKKYVKNK